MNNKNYLEDQRSSWKFDEIFRETNIIYNNHVIGQFYSTLFAIFRFLFKVKFVYNELSSHFT